MKINLPESKHYNKRMQVTRHMPLYIRIKYIRNNKENKYSSCLGIRLSREQISWKQTMIVPAADAALAVAYSPAQELHNLF